MRCFDAFFSLTRTCCWTNSWVVGDLRCLDACNEVTVRDRKWIRLPLIEVWCVFSACLLQVPDPSYAKVVQYCDQVLQVNPSNTKALFRKGRALYHQKDIDCALRVLKEAINLPDGQKGFSQKCRLFDDNFVTGCTGSFQHDNFRCSAGSDTNVIKITFLFQCFLTHIISDSVNYRRQKDNLWDSIHHCLWNVINIHWL